MRGGTTRELRDTAVAELRKGIAGHLGTNKDKRIRIQRHLTTISTLGSMINAAVELGVQSVNEELDSEAYTPVG